MKITIDIPDAFVNDTNTMVTIDGETFHYARPDSRYYGLQSNFSQTDELKNDGLRKHCDAIAEHIVAMVIEDLI